MISWQDEGLLLALRPHGETHYLTDVLTLSRGRVRALSQRDPTGRMPPVGACLEVFWSARRENQLGQMRWDSYYFHHWEVLLGCPDRLEATRFLAHMLQQFLPERNPYPELYNGLYSFIQSLAGEDWRLKRLVFEMLFLEELGYGLNLSPMVAEQGEGCAPLLSPPERHPERVEGHLSVPPFMHALRVRPCLSQDVSGKISQRDVQLGLSVTAHLIEKHLSAA